MLAQGPSLRVIPQVLCNKFHSNADSNQQLTDSSLGLQSENKCVLFCSGIHNCHRKKDILRFETMGLATNLALAT